MVLCLFYMHRYCGGIWPIHPCLLLPFWLGKYFLEYQLCNFSGTSVLIFVPCFNTFRPTFQPHRRSGWPRQIGEMIWNVILKLDQSEFDTARCLLHKKASNPFIFNLRSALQLWSIKCSLLTHAQHYLLYICEL